MTEFHESVQTTKKLGQNMKHSLILSYSVFFCYIITTHLHDKAQHKLIHETKGKIKLIKSLKVFLIYMMVTSSIYVICNVSKNVTV
jgi:hypothetical protein